MPRVQSKSAKRAKSPVNNQYLEKKSSLEIFKISYTSMQKIKFECCLIYICFYVYQLLHVLVYKA